MTDARWAVVKGERTDVPMVSATAGLWERTGWRWVVWKDVRWGVPLAVHWVLNWVAWHTETGEKEGNHKDLRIGDIPQAL